MTGEVKDFIKVKEAFVGGAINVSRTGRPSEAFAEVNATMGGFFNAAKSYIDFNTLGKVSGLGSAHNSEMRTPLNGFGGVGSYGVHEFELVFQGTTGGSPLCFGWFQVSGTQASIDAWEDQANAAAFIFKGLTSGAGSIFDATQGPAGANASLKIIIGTTPYWIMLSTTAS